MSDDRFMNSDYVSSFTQEPTNIEKPNQNKGEDARSPLPQPDGIILSAFTIVTATKGIVEQSSKTPAPQWSEIEIGGVIVCLVAILAAVSVLYNFFFRR